MPALQTKGVHASALAAAAHDRNWRMVTRALITMRCDLVNGLFVLHSVCAALIDRPLE